MDGKPGEWYGCFGMNYLDAFNAHRERKMRREAEEQLHTLRAEAARVAAPMAAALEAADVHATTIYATIPDAEHADYRAVDIAFTELTQHGFELHVSVLLAVTDVGWWNVCMEARERERSTWMRYAPGMFERWGTTARVDWTPGVHIMIPPYRPREPIDVSLDE